MSRVLSTQILQVTDMTHDTFGPLLPKELHCIHMLSKWSLRELSTKIEKISYDHWESFYCTDVTPKMLEVALASCGID